MNDLMTYELKLNDSEDGVFAMSLVNQPAIEIDWVSFSKQNKMQHFDSEKQILTGPALIPDLFIYRRDNDIEYQVYLTKETIEQVVQRYAKNASNLNVTLDHQIDVPKGAAYVFESWIVSSDKDKAHQMGFDVPEGTWMISMKIESEELWQLAKQKRVKGFSIEGLFSHVRVEQQKNDNKIMSTLLNKLSNLLDEFKSVELEDDKEDKEEEMETTLPLADGSLVYISDDGFLFDVDQDGNPSTPKEAGEYELADGNVITVGENGEIISEMPEEEEDSEDTEVTEEETEETEVTDEEFIVYVMEDGTLVEIDADSNATINNEAVPDGEHTLADGGMITIEDGKLVNVISAESMSIINQLREQVEQTKQKLKELKAENKELKVKYDELAAAPSVDKLSNQDVQQDVPKWKQVADAVRKAKS